MKAVKLRLSDDSITSRPSGSIVEIAGFVVRPRYTEDSNFIVIAVTKDYSTTRPSNSDTWFGLSELEAIDEEGERFLSVMRAVRARSGEDDAS